MGDSKEGKIVVTETWLSTFKEEANRILDGEIDEHFWHRFPCEGESLNLPLIWVDIMTSEFLLIKEREAAALANQQGNSHETDAVTLINNPGRVESCCIPTNKLQRHEKRIDEEFQRTVSTVMEEFNCHDWGDMRFADMLCKLRTNEFVGVSCLMITFDRWSAGFWSTFVTVCEAAHSNPHLKNVSIVMMLDEHLPLRLPPECAEYFADKDNWIMVNSDDYGMSSMRLLFMRPKRCLQKLVSDTSAIQSYFSLRVHFPPAIDIFLYNRNPTLTLCFNNYFFTAPHKPRNGSHTDVANIRAVCHAKHMPVLLFSDLDSSQMAQVMECLKSSDFSMLRNLFVFIMSHGSDNYIIHTREGVFNLYDCVVQPLVANRSLSNVNVLLFVVACRHGIHGVPIVALDEIPENFHLFFSVPKGRKSLRHRELGTCCIQAVHKQLREPIDQLSVRELGQRIQESFSELFPSFPTPDCTLFQSEDIVELSRRVAAPSIDQPLEDLTSRLLEILHESRPDDSDKEVEPGSVAETGSGTEPNSEADLKIT